MGAKLFGREPALYLGLVAAGIQLLSALGLDLTSGQQGALNAVAVAAAGLITAALVRGDQVAPAVLGLVQAVLALALAFGAELSADMQATVMAFASAVVAMFVRQVVTAPVPAHHG